MGAAVRQRQYQNGWQRSLELGQVRQKDDDFRTEDQSERLWTPSIATEDRHPECCWFSHCNRSAGGCVSCLTHLEMTAALLGAVELYC